MTSYSFIHPGKPHPKQRPRTGKGGRVYTPRESRLAEEEIAFSYDGPTFEGPLGMRVYFYPTFTKVRLFEDLSFERSPLRGDIDNYAKTVMDALVGFAYKDDRQIVHLEAGKKKY